MIALCAVAYMLVAAACVYLEGRLSGDADFAPLWLLWPVMVPLVLVVFTAEWIGDLGESHHK